MRQFILDGQKIQNGLVMLEGKDYRYLRQVLRVKPGDMLALRLESGELQNATVARVDEKSRRVLVQLCADGAVLAERSAGAGSPAESITRGVQASELDGTAAAPEFWLMQLITKPQKFEQIVRQATECGVRRIIPVKGEFSEKSSILALENSKKERLERIIREARQQSGSPVGTELCQPLSLEEAISLWQESSGLSESAEIEAGKMEQKSSPAFVLYERNERTESLSSVISSIKKEDIKRVCICVGCEGGISPSEIDILCKKGLFHPIHFAVNILRAETAALYGIAAVQSFILSE